MNVRATPLLFTAILLICSTLVSAQQPRKSPHDKASVTLAGKQITIEYGRPSLRGRKAVGGTLVPYGEVWRLGADEATKLTTPVAIKIGSLTVPAGSYALFTKATESSWTLIVNKVFDQWGAFSYSENQAQDLGTVPLDLSKPTSTVEQFTIAFNKTGERTAMLALSWENTIASVPVTVP